MVLPTIGTLAEHVREIQRRLAEARQQVAALEAELRGARSALSGKEPKSAKAKSRHGFTNGVRKRPIQPNSSVDWTLRALKTYTRPMTLDAIIAWVAQHDGPEIKAPTLASNLSRYVKHGDTFTRTAPNTYGLIQWDHPSADELFGLPEEPPPDERAETMPIDVADMPIPGVDYDVD